MDHILFWIIKDKNSNKFYKRTLIWFEIILSKIYLLVQTDHILLTMKILVCDLNFS